MGFGTRLIHNGNLIDKNTGAVSIPIYQTSTFHQHDIDERQEYLYSRWSNPTRAALEETIAVLEGADKGFAFSSGMAAISSAFSIFSSGDHILVCEDVYGGTHKICSSFFNRFGLDVTFVDAANPEAIKQNIKSNTKAIYLETPSNPLLKITDLKSVMNMVKAYNILVIVDNTFMSPYLQRPIELGADIVVHSATKFIGGHSDVVGGLAAVKGEELAEKIQFVQTNFGSILGPQDSWLLLRGLKTLKVRMDCQQKSAQKLSEWLMEQEEVLEVYYPGLLHHKDRHIHFSQADGAGAVLSFKTAHPDIAKKFMKNVKLAAVAVSLGGVETIVSYPSYMSHAGIPEDERASMGITDNLIRVSLGLEDIDDLINDFKIALKV